MADDSFSLDELLEDLDAVVVQPHRVEHDINSKFVPHPPSRATNQQSSLHNPKTKFAVRPGSSHNSPDMAHPSNPGTSSGVAAASSTDTDENSVDHLLNLINSPKIVGKSSSGNTTGTAPYSSFSPPANRSATSAAASSEHSDTTQHTTFFGKERNNGGNANSSFKHDNRNEFGRLGTIPAVGAVQQFQRQQHQEIPPSMSSPFDSPSSHGSSSTMGTPSASRKSSSGTVDGGAWVNTSLPNTIKQQQQQQQHFSSPPNRNHMNASNNTNIHHHTSAENNNRGSGMSGLQPLGHYTGDGAGAGGKKSHMGIFSKVVPSEPSNSNTNNLQDIMSSSTIHTANTNTNKNTSSSFPPSSGAMNSNGNGGGFNNNFTNNKWENNKKDTFLPTSVNSIANDSNNNAKQRCSRVVLAGAAVPRGRKTSSFASCACNTLRCLQCNFKVHCFSGCAWDSTVDYMFLRNTVPNETKLAARLVRDSDSCAYCCQCSYASESGERELALQGARGDPQWICAGH